MDGRILLDGLRPGLHRVTFIARSHAPLSIAVEVPPQGGEGTFALKPGGAIGFRVVGTAGEPLEGARVELLDEGGRDAAGDAGFFSSSLTAEDGSLRIAPLAPGLYRALASRDGLRSPEVQVAVQAGEDSEALLRISE